MENLQRINPDEGDESLISKEALLNFLRYWPWLTGAVLTSLFLAYLYMNLTVTTYASFAEIRIIEDDRESDIASQITSNFDFGGEVNLQNEMAVLKSFRLLEQVVDELNLDISCYESAFFKSISVWNHPFKVSRKSVNDDFIEAREYQIEVLDGEILVTDEYNNIYTLPLGNLQAKIPELPFHIVLTEDIGLRENRKYKIVVSPRKEAVFELIANLKVQAVHKKGEVLSLSILGENWQRSEAILNTIIDKFKKDGIVDRQLISKQTLDFIDERFSYLATELDSIEMGKQDFKQDNSLTYIQEDATFALRQKTDVDKEVADTQTQISLSRLLKKNVINQDAYSLLPSNIGVQSSSVNSLVSDYNDLALQRSKLLASVGENHPSLMLLNGQLEQAKSNILKTVEVFEHQLRTSLGRLNQERNEAGDRFLGLPQKEKTLRSIERQQSIKENLFLLLLQKREEAAINYAVTAPSFKVVDYAVTADEPISPKGMLIYPLFFAFGILVPSGVIYARFAFDNKIYSMRDIRKKNPHFPVVAEIPVFEDIKIGLSTNSRSILTESFRVLSTNTDYHLSGGDAEKPKVIYVTSSIKGEGKTFVALNLSLAYAGLKKRVLLINADLRNSGLQGYFKNLDSSSIGLSDYLHSPVLAWEECIHEGYAKSEHHKICPHGTILDNPPELLSNPNYKRFLDRAKREFDYIIVDTAPTLLISDTLLISKYADATLFVIRAGFTEKRLLEHSKDLESAKKIRNVAYVLNNAGLDKNHGYNYGYGYGYTS